MNNSPKYKNISYSINVRVKDLLNRMTLKEKVDQTLCIYAKKGNFQDEAGDFDEEKAKTLFLTGAGRVAEVGFVEDSAKKMAELTNKIQKFYLEETRLGIPVIFIEECLHGQMVNNATSFPQPIALASSWNPKLIEGIYSLIAEETRSRGGHHALTPVADVAREPRWGRVEETFGEDTFLVTKMTVAATKGFQGEKGSFNNNKKVIATLKHFVAHAQPEGGSNCAPVNVSERVLREVFFPPFKEAVEVGAMSVMASYNEVNGIPSHKNTWLLNDVLRKEWGFKGFIVSDYYAVNQLYERHGVARDKKEAAFQAFTSGIDIELPLDECYSYLVELINEGRISEQYLNKVVTRILESKFRLGLFDSPYVDPLFADKFCGSEEQSPIALKAALESITLLKNEGCILPLKKDNIKTIAVIGPNANEVLLGGYSGKPKYFSKVLDGIQKKVDNQIEILYAEGCKITEPGDWEGTDKVELSNPSEDRERITEAIKISKQADIVILALGGNALTSREAWNENHLGDRPSLDLVGMQNELIEALANTGKPLISLLFNGKPLSVNYLNEKATAILECWYLGQETGNAVANILFGDYNPGGKLPISFPRSVGHIPAYYNHKPNDRRGYLFEDVNPLYAFGYGLSYTNFEYSNLRLDKSEILISESCNVLIDIKNTGNYSGQEIVQMYIRDCISSVTRPVKELKGFDKVFLEIEETKTVTLKITPKELAFWDVEMNYVIEAGEFEIMVGSSSNDKDLTKIILNVK